MRDSSGAGPAWAALFLCVSGILAAVAASGCSRAKYQLQADREAYHVIAERNCDPRWHTNDYCIEMDPCSRYFDPYSLNRPPMPQDDPSSHRYMQCVDGKKGWKHWYDNGCREDLENPAWQQAVAEYVETTEDGAVKLTVDSALRLAYVNSPSHQDQLETLYLSALDVTRERFRLDTQFFGGYDVTYDHNGYLTPAALVYDSTLGRWVDTAPFRGAGVENNRLTVGRPSTADPALLAHRRFATAGELLVGFANSFVFEYTGGDANLAASLASFSFIQPLLRGAGRDIALEQLTLAERTLLANVRAYSQYRQGFYTQVAIGELGVTGTQRGGFTTNLQSFSGQRGVGGFLGLLQQLQEIRNSENNLKLQLRTLARLEALLENDFIDLVQVDQFRQDIERQRSELLLQRNNYELALDTFKTGALGLPPDLPIELDDSLIRQFRLVPPEATEILDSILELQDRVGRLPDVPEVGVIDSALDDAFELVKPVRLLLDGAREDLARMNEVVPRRERSMTDEMREVFRRDRERLNKLFTDLEVQFEAATAKLANLRDGLSDQTGRATARGLVSWIADFMRLVERFTLVPAQARLETITVTPIDLEAGDAFQIGLANRLDFMNGRAALVDRWRAIRVTADALQSAVNVTADGDIRTARNNPVSFRAPTSSLRLGLEIDAPFTRLLERNDYRESLIEYQRSRRGFIQSRDSLHLGLRELLRQIEQLRQNLEIQRRAVTIAIRRVDQTQLSLNPPRFAPQPGQRPPINPTTAINLLGAQTSLRNSQNAFLAAWLNHYAARMRLYRELGIMVLDPEGRWIERPIGGSEHDAPPSGDDPIPEEAPLPPAIPLNWLELADDLQRDGSTAQPTGDSTAAVPTPSAPVGTR